MDNQMNDVMNGGTTVAEKHCEQCGAVVAQDQELCQNCGSRVNGAAPMVEVKVEEETKPVKKKSKKGLIAAAGGLVAVLGIGAVIVISIIVAIVLLFVFRKVPVDALMLDKTELELVEEETYTVSCTVYPTNASDKTVVWTTSDEDVATVNEVGLITAVAEGECTIEATAGEKSAELTVTVKKDVPDFKVIYDEYCSSTWAEVGTDNSYLQIDTNPYNIDDYSISEALNAVEKINTALGLPDSLYKDMLYTSWGMGKQSETFESVGITVEWTYHPDKGMELRYKLINK